MSRQKVQSGSCDLHRLGEKAQSQRQIYKDPVNAGGKKATLKFSQEEKRKQSELINPRTQLSVSRVVVSVRTLETDSAHRGRCAGTDADVTGGKRGRAFLRAASAGLCASSPLREQVTGEKRRPEAPSECLTSCHK